MALFQKDPAVRELQRRVILMFIPLVAAFTVIVWRLHEWQVEEGPENVRQAELANTVEERLAAPRGRLLDRKGRVLATNRSAFSVFVIPKLLPREKPLWTELNAVLRLSPERQKELQSEVNRAIATAPSLASADRIPLKASELSAGEVAALSRTIVRFNEVEVTRDDSGRSFASINVALYPSRARVLRDVKDILALDDEQLSEIEIRIKALNGPDLAEPIPVKRDVDARRELPQLEAQAHRLPGVLIKKELLRVHPYGERAAHIVGFMQEMTKDEYQSLRTHGYRLGDMVGRLGAERLFERELRGVDGVESVVVDARGRRRDDPLARNLVKGMPQRAAIPGHDVYLSIDVDLQQTMEQLATGRPKVAFVALDANTGQIRAMLSKPSFDPNAVLKNWKQLLADPMKPLNDRVTQETFFPGSTYKIVAGMSALESHKVTPQTRFTCGGSLWFGRKFECHRRHGSTDYKHGYMFSCDVYFYNLGMRVGMDGMAHVARDLGYGERPGLDLTKEAEGVVPTIAHHRKVSPEGYVRGFDLNTAIGQGEVRVTPLQQALAYAAITNGGRLLKPTLVEKVVAANGAVRVPEVVVKRKLHVSERTRRLTHEGLTAVMNELGGTAYFRRSKRVKVGGKTGTAQRRHNIKGKDWERTYEERDDAWFVAFAPADKPEIAIAVLVEHGGHGGATSAPIAVKIAEGWFDLEKRLAPVVASRSGPGRGPGPGPASSPGAKPRVGPHPARPAPSPPTSGPKPQASSNLGGGSN